MFPKLVEHKGDMPVIRDQFPTIFHIEGHPPGDIQQSVRDAFVSYRDSLPSAYQSLLDRFHLRDAAVKVVGVGSVGTACFVLLLTAAEGDPLFLQAKEARPLGPGAVRRQGPLHEPAKEDVAGRLHAPVAVHDALALESGAHA